MERKCNEICVWNEDGICQFESPEFYTSGECMHKLSQKEYDEIMEEL